MIENLTILGWAHLYVFWFTLLMLTAGIGLVTLAGAYIWHGLEDHDET